MKLRCAGILVLIALGAPAGAQDAIDPGARPPDRATAAPLPADQDAMFGPPAPSRPMMLRGTDRDAAACLQALNDLGASFEKLPPVTDDADPDCGIARPIRVTEILPDVALEGDGRMRCETALSLALWGRQFVLPGLAAMPDTPRLQGLRLGTGYDCRNRVGTEESPTRPSEHAVGNAVDIMAFLLEGGEEITVQPRDGDGNMIEAFQRMSRASACLFFTTVLGPGSNAAHDDHLHFDVIERAGGFRLCD